MCGRAQFQQPGNRQLGENDQLARLGLEYDDAFLFGVHSNINEHQKEKY